MVSMTNTPMPQHLDHLLQKLVKEVSDPAPSASNTVFVFRNVIAEAYATGHRDGHGQVTNQQWMVDELKEAFAKRKAKPEEHGAAASQDDQDNFGA